MIGLVDFKSDCDSQSSVIGFSLGAPICASRELVFYLLSFPLCVLGEKWFAYFTLSESTVSLHGHFAFIIVFKINN